MSIGLRTLDEDPAKLEFRRSGAGNTFLAQAQAPPATVVLEAFRIARPERIGPTARRAAPIRLRHSRLQMRTTDSVVGGRPMRYLPTSASPFRSTESCQSETGPIAVSPLVASDWRSEAIVEWLCENWTNRIEPCLGRYRRTHARHFFCICRCVSNARWGRLAPRSRPT